MIKYFFLLTIIYGIQAIRVADDVKHFQNPEKCKPCYNHRLLETKFQLEQYDSDFNNVVFNFV